MKISGKLNLYKQMLRIRLFEEAIVDNYSCNEMRCPVHLSIGQEASAVGVCNNLRKTDWVFSGHRNHAHYIAKGGSLKKMIAEIYGKITGCCKGKGGSMHLTDQESGFIGATPIVGSTVPIAAGAALTSKLRKEKRVDVIFLGDGAMETGVVHETINFAVLKKLPLLFVCENNLYSVYSPLSVRQPANRTLSQLAAGHGIKTFKVTSNDVFDISKKTAEIYEYILNNKCPVFFEISTYRYREHCGPNFDNNIGYREINEYNDWKENDPIDKLATSLPLDLKENICKEINLEIKLAFDFAKSSSYPEENTITENIYA